MEHSDFKSIDKSVENCILKEKGSKFIGFIYPITNLCEVETILVKLKNLHIKATHLCYAYRLGLLGEYYRANDAGEPSGSAGLPIYNQLLAHEITNVLLVVVRYYGGTKLGVPGLVKAYRDTAKLSIEQAKIVLKTLKIQIEIEFDYPQQKTIHSLLHQFSAEILSFVTTDICKILASVELKNKQNISEKLSEIHLINYKFLD